VGGVALGVIVLTTSNGVVLTGSGGSNPHIGNTTDFTHDPGRRRLSLGLPIG
jgi:hypothetical protein